MLKLVLIAVTFFSLINADLMAGTEVQNGRKGQGESLRVEIEKNVY